MKKSLFVLIPAICLMFASCGSNNVEYSTLGKSGPVTMSIASHSKIVRFDGEQTKLKGSCKLEPGFHTFGIDYAHYTSSYSAKAYVSTSYYFEDGKKYTMKAIENGNVLVLFIRDDSPVISDYKYYAKKAEDPEMPAERIKFINGFPKDRKFEVVATYQFSITGSAFAYKSITDELAVKQLEILAANSEKDIDALVDCVTYRGMSGLIANAVGIKFID